MILDICSYNECAINAINIQDLQSNIDHLFFLFAIKLHQKPIDRLNVERKEKMVVILDRTLCCYLLDG